MKRKAILILLASFVWVSILQAGVAEDHLARIRHDLDSLAVSDPRFGTFVDVSVTAFPVADLLKSLAIGNGLNINLSLDRFRGQITCNLEQVPIKDVLFLCCRENGLDLTVDSGIVNIFPYAEVPSLPEIAVSRDDATGLYSYDFSGCTLDELMRSLVSESGQNVIFQRDLSGRQVYGYGKDVTIRQMIESIAASNGLRASVSEDGIWYLYEGAAKNNNLSFYSNDDQGDGGDHCVKVFPLKFRTVDDLVDIIPEKLKKDMDIRVFPDLNSLILSGTKRGVGDLESYLTDIDKSVPMISIDVVIVDATDRKSRNTGIKFGKGLEPSGPSYGQVSPGVDFSLGASQINRLINAFNGIGLVNLGQVGENFYAELKMLEEDGNITLRSTPRLSTLNGHKATLTSGEVKYYKESQVNIIGTQNPMQSESYMWKNVEASFTLELLPYVSADSTITIHVNLNQDEFTERNNGDLNAPPGKTKRGFNSIVKVHDGEMVLLGGIEKNLLDDSSAGLPFIARIPVLRLFFGNVSKTKEIRKLNVFIRPVVIQ
jgi:Type II secretory pathway, component PulD